MEAFQKRNPFPLSKKDKRKQQIEQEQLLRDLISPDPLPIRTISRRNLNKVFHKIHEKLDPMFDMIDNIHDILPDVNIFKYEGCAPMVQCKEFYGDPFKDNVRIQPNMFEAIDERNTRDKIPLPPKYIKKPNNESNSIEIC
uniref:Uncharacterized protein n=1 Tax=Panagrolaimus superbus TaxID=310955 RepID=A0A914XV72_9BILA